MTYRDLGRLTNMLTALLALRIAFGIGMSFLPIVLAATQDSGSMITIYTRIGYFGTTLRIVTLIVFAMWLFGAVRNVHARGVPGLRFTPGWSVGWYFIPFANLVMPYLGVRELWNASHGIPDLAKRKNRILVWWLSWLVTSISGTPLVTLLLARFAGQLSPATIGLIYVPIGLISYVAYGLAIWMTRSIAAAQRRDGDGGLAMVFA